MNIKLSICNKEQVFMSFIVCLNYQKMIKSEKKLDFQPEDCSDFFFEWNNKLVQTVIDHSRSSKITSKELSTLLFWRLSELSYMEKLPEKILLKNDTEVSLWWKQFLYGESIVLVSQNQVGLSNQLSSKVKNNQNGKTWIRNLVRNISKVFKRGQESGRDAKRFEMATNYHGLHF